MNRYHLLVLLSFLYINSNAQQDIAHTISLDICKCLSSSKDTTTNGYNKCFASSFIKFQKEISQEYQLNSKSSYEESKSAGHKMRVRVEYYLNKSCLKAGRFRKIEHKKN